jgi:HEAT repeat protein
VDPVEAGALGELVATAVTAACGKSWKAVRQTPEAKSVKAAVDRALAEALRDAYKSEAADDAWISGVAGTWERAFVPDVIHALVRCLASLEDEGEFAAVAARALQASGCDVTELGRTFWVEQFLCVLPRLLFQELSDAALRSDSAVRGLVGHLLEQRIDVRAAGDPEATPREFREDMIALLRLLDIEARTGRLPAYLPRGADVSALARTVRVRPGLRIGPRANEKADKGRAYRLPLERVGYRLPPKPWPEIADVHKRLVVLADPGLGKSWLIRTETHRLCLRALVASDAGSELDDQWIPLPMRCDQLTAYDRQPVSEAVAQHLLAQRLLPTRSVPGLRRLVEGGKVVLLLDALDELTADEEYGCLKEQLRTWQSQIGDGARCVITSRIAGYRGSPLPDAVEVELQAFTQRDVTAVINAWGLPESVAAQVHDGVKAPAVASMVRIPLLLALLCSVAAELTEEQQFPVTRAQLYERVLRWFLTRAHRAEEHWRGPELSAEEVDGLLDVLAPVAFHFATLPAGWADLMPPFQLRDALRQAGPAFTERMQSASDILRDLSVGTGILVPAGNPSAGRRCDYLFLHRTFAEYLVAHHLAALPLADWLEVVDQHMWFDSDWAEVIPLLGAQLNPGAARKLVEHLLDVTHDPFHHAMFMALRVLAERPDLDHLLSSDHLKRVADKVLSLIGHSTTHDATLSAFAAVPRLAQPIIDHLLDCLTGRKLVLQLAAAEAMKGRDTSEITAGLLRVLDDWALNSELRDHVIEALQTLDSPSATHALLALTESPESNSQVAAARALVQNPAPAVTDALFALLSDIDPWVQGVASSLLARRDVPQSTSKLLGLLIGSEPLVRAAAARALRGQGLTGPDAPEVTEKLLTAVEDPEPSIQAAAANALAGREGPEVTRTLLFMLHHYDPPVRAAAVYALADRDGSAVTDRLLGRLADKSSRVRIATVRALRRSPDITNRLIPLLGDQDPKVRLAAVGVLAKREDSEVTDGLLGCLADPDEDVRETAVVALWSRDGSLVTDGLLGCLTDPKLGLRARAIGALADRRGHEVNDKLLALAHDLSSPGRVAAVLALVRRGALEAADGPTAFLGDPAQACQDTLAAHAFATGGRPDDLLALAQSARVLSSGSLSNIYHAAQAMTERVFRLLPIEMQASVRADLALLSENILADRPWSEYSGLDFKHMAKGLGLKWPPS